MALMMNNNLEMTKTSLTLCKWTATLCLIVGFTLFAGGITLGFWIQMTGGVMWLCCAVAMRDAALITTNAAMTTGGLVGWFCL